MRKISDEAQALIERVWRASANCDLVPRRAEEALHLHLAGLGLPEREITWLLEIPRAKDLPDNAAVLCIGSDWHHAERRPSWQKNRAWRNAVAVVNNFDRDGPWHNNLLGLPPHEVRCGLGQPWPREYCDDEFLDFLTPSEYCAQQACAYVNGMVAHPHPEARRLAGIYQPMVAAYEAGLLGYWAEPTKTVAIARPTVHLHENRLHCADGPAVLWPSGTMHYFWRGTPVPAPWIVDPAGIDVNSVLNLANEEQHQAGIDILRMRLGSQPTA